jgi:transaldolase
MKIFLDTANINEIKEAVSLGVLDGVTTNPSLIAKEGRDFRQVLEEICAAVNGPVSAEVVSTDFDGMVKEGQELSRVHQNIVVSRLSSADWMTSAREEWKSWDRSGRFLTITISPQKS